MTFTQTDRQFKYRYNSERDGVYSLQFSYDATVLAVGYGDGTIEASSHISRVLLKWFTWKSAFVSSLH